MSRIDIAIIGYGEHSKVIEASINVDLFNFIGYMCPLNDYSGSKHLGEDTELENILSRNKNINFILGIGKLSLRQSLLSKYYTNINFVNIIHSKAILSKKVEMGKGVFIAQGAILQNNVQIDDHCIVNSGAIIEHDCCIAKNTHIAPGCILGGGCRIGKNSLIGLGSVVKDHVTIGDNVVIGAGSVVISNINNNEVFAGVPAKKIK